MKKILLILAISFWGCSAQQEQNNSVVTSHTPHQVNNENTRFRLTSTTICEQTNLSNQFDISINCKRYTDSTVQRDSCILKVFIKDKTTKSTLDSISIISLLFFGNLFSNCDSMTSYSTKFKSDREIVDNYFGDIVVADFNFDGIDDIAVINDSGGNGGPFYSYYTQTSDRKFTLNGFLTDSVTFFPTKIDKAKKRLITYVHA